MIFPAVHGFMQFRNCRYEFFGSRNPEGRGPVLFHAAEKVYEPLTGDVVTNEDESEGERLDDSRDEVVHVRISVKLLAFTAMGFGGYLNALLAFLQVPNAHGHDHL